MRKFFSFSILVLLLSLVTASKLQAESKNCAACGKGITENYLEYDGKPYCSQKCFETALPKCSVCGKSVGGGSKQGEFFKVNDRIFCSEKCFEKSLPKCAACGKPAKKQLRSADDTTKIYCSQECYQTSLPKCELCQKPLNSWKEMAGHLYCNQCAELPKCLDCRLPGAQVGLPDGRHICQTCQKEAVVSQEEAQRIFEQVRSNIKEQLKLSTDHRITFRLVDANALEEITKVKIFSEQGLYSHKWKTYQESKKRVPDSDTFVVYILSYLTPRYFRNIAAHELAHDIHDAMFPNVKGKELEEGFAEYISSLMNSYWGNDSLNAEKLLNQEKIYAQGYQKFLKMAEKNGLSDVLAYMEKQDKSAGAKPAKKRSK